MFRFRPLRSLSVVSSWGLFCRRLVLGYLLTGGGCVPTERSPAPTRSTEREAEGASAHREVLPVASDSTQDSHDERTVGEEGWKLPTITVDAQVDVVVIEKKE